MKYFIIDIEANALEDPDTIWCVVVEELDEDKVYTFTSAIEFIDWLNQFKDYPAVWIGHNIIEYDAPVIKKVWDIDLGDLSLIDTLILSRLYSPKMEGGHSLEAWGERLNYKKAEFSDFSEFSEEMLEYCKQDVRLTKKLYKYLKSKLGDVDFTISLEHRVALELKKAKEHGFFFDLSKAIELKVELEKERHLIDETLKFPDIEKVEWFTPKKNNASKGYVAGVPFKKVKFVPFNPNSGQHVINELWKAGWKPTEKTNGYKELIKAGSSAPDYEKKLEKYKKYGWKLNENNLATLPDTAPSNTKSFLRRTIYETRIRKLDEWLECLSDDGAIHGDIIALGTWTHRMAHRSPNLGNISAKKSIKYHTPELNKLAFDLGGQLRSLWIARPGKVLVGTDAEGIQLRVLACYMEDEEFIKAVTEGKKDEGTDPHSFNQKKIGIGTRDNAKTFKITDVYKPIEFRGHPVKDNPERRLI